MRYIIFVALLVFAFPAHATKLCMIGWNLESAGSRQSALEEIMERHAKCDVFGFSEVAGRHVLEGLAEAAKDGSGRSFDWIISNTSRSGPENTPDFLALLWNTRKLVLIRLEELFSMREGRGRAPLVGYFEIKETQKTLAVMVNHLHRGSADKRKKQAQALNAWAANQTESVVALGDYNMDWVVPDGAKYDPAFDSMLAGKHWKWVKPDPVFQTTCFEGSNAGILDFVFTAGPAQSWGATSEVLEREGFCPDGRYRPDHRPVRAIFTFD